MGLLEFATSAVILMASAALWLSRRQPSALLFAALSFYAVAASLQASSLSIEYGSTAYARSGAIFLLGTILLVLCMDLAGRAFAISEDTPTAFIWNRTAYGRHSENGLIFALLGVLLLVLDRPNLSVAWNAARLTTTRLSVLGTLLLLMAIPSCVSVLRTGRKGMAIALYVACSAGFIVSGSRALVMSGVLFGAWMLLQRFRKPVGQVITVTLVIPVAFFLHGLLRFFRGLGLIGIVAAVQNGSLLTQIYGSVLSTDPSGGELSIARFFVYSTTVSSDREFGTLTSMRRILTLLLPPIPGIVEKPVDVTYRLWGHALIAGMFNNASGSTFLHDIYQEGTGGSLHPTLLGEMFLTGGWWSLFISVIFLSVIVTAIDRYLMSTTPIMGLTLLGPTLAGYFFVARGNSVVGLGYFLYLFVIFQALTLTARGLHRWKRSTKVVRT